MALRLIPPPAPRTSPNRTAGEAAPLVSPPSTSAAAPPRESASARNPVAVIENPAVCVRELSLYYGESAALQRITMDFPRQQVTALIGPSGCGKSTLLRCLNRMNDLIDNVRTRGCVLLDGQNILDPALDVIALRRRVGMVFQRPTPFPKSIYENVAYGLRIAGISRRQALLAVARNLERIADHAVNIAEDVIYLVEGRIARHETAHSASSAPTRSSNEPRPPS